MRDSNGLIAQLFKSGIFLFIGSIFSTFGGFLARTITARFLTTDEYGAIALGLSIISASTTIVLLGLDQGLGRYLPRQESETIQRRFLSAAFSTAIPISILAGLLLFGFGPTLGKLIFDNVMVGQVFRIFGLAIPCIVTMNLCIGGVQGMEKSLPKTLAKDFTIPVTRLGAIGIVLYIGGTTLGFASAFVISFLAGSAVGVYFLIRYLPISEVSDIQLRGLEKERLELLSFAIPLTLTGVMHIVFSNVDTLLVGYFLTTSDVGVYDVAYLLSNFIVVILSSFLFLFMPIFSRLHSTGEQEQMNDIYSLITKWVVIISIPLLLIFIIFPSIVISVTFGQDYTGGSIALSILALGFFTNTATGPNGNALMAVGKTRFITLTTTAVAVLNFCLNIFLIPRIGVLGAAIATALSYSALNVANSLELFRKYGIHPLNVSTIYLISASSVLLGASYSITEVIGFEEVVFKFVVLMFFIIIYPILALIIVDFDSKEIKMVSRFESRIGIDLTLIKRFMR